MDRRAMATLALTTGDFITKAISPLREMAAYEALWREKGASFKTIANKFREHEELVPSEIVPPSLVDEYVRELSQFIKQHGLNELGVRIHGTVDYPSQLRDAKNPLELFYYQGNWDLVYSPSVAVVGARKVSREGALRTKKLVKALVEDHYTVVSGLAEGVDSVAHKTAIACGGKTIAVIGTPLTMTYPRENSDLQRQIAEGHLLISQVPFLRYLDQNYRSNRSFFPERNITMSALTKATVIVEASDTSGTLYQARAAISQGRKLFILDSCFDEPSITWPQRFAQKGAIRVKDYSDIQSHLKD